jgi:argininosuccinate synthase
MHLRDSLIPRYAQVVYNGYWFAPEREALQAFFDQTQERVNGEARLKLYKGNVVTLGRRSDFRLYDEKTVTFEDDEDVYNQADAAGFIRLNALRLRRMAEARLGAGE